MKPTREFMVVMMLCAAVAVRAQDDDSYLAALKHTHEVDTSIPDQRTSRNDFQPSVWTESNAPNNGAAHATYGAPSEWDSSAAYPTYNAPRPVYGPPPATYEAPRPIYAAVPTIHQVYYGHSAPPQPSGSGNYSPAAWEGPRDGHWLLNKLKLKLDFFTIGKILLKLIIFKKIVKFIAVICLLLFLPKLQAHQADKEDDDQLEERRQFDVKYNLNERINEVTTFALTAVDAFAKKYPDACAGPFDITCRLGKMMDAVDDQYPYKKVIQMYLPESEKQRVLEINDSR